MEGKKPQSIVTNNTRVMHFVRCVQALLNQNKNQKESPFPYREIEGEWETERQSLQFLPIEMRSIPLGFSVSPTSINNHLNFNLKKQKQQRQQQNQYFFTSSTRVSRHELTLSSLPKSGKISYPFKLFIHILLDLKLLWIIFCWLSFFFCVFYLCFTVLLFEKLACNQYFVD